MINGAHVIVYSRAPEADRALIRDVLALTHVDVGGGWLIFGLPPAEVAVHPSLENNVHELYFMCEDVAAFVSEMAGRAVACSPIVDQGWGLVTQMKLPGGGQIGVYQPRHERPRSTTAKAGGSLKGGKAKTGKVGARKKAQAGRITPRRRKR